MSISVPGQKFEQELRRVIREEIEAALDRRDAHGLDALLADISEPLDEVEEMAAVLATLSDSEWTALVQRLHERQATKGLDVDSPPSLQ